MNDSGKSDLVLRSAKARQQYWIEERDRARAAGNDEAAGNARRFIDEYVSFIEMIERDGRDGRSAA